MNGVFSYECGKIFKVFPFVLSFMFCEFLLCLRVWVCFLLNCSYYLQKETERSVNLVLLLFPNHWLLASIDVLYVCVLWVCLCMCVRVFFKCKRRKLLAFINFIYFFRFSFYIILKAITWFSFNLINLFRFLLNNMKTNFQLSIFHLDFSSLVAICFPLL